MGNPKVIAAPQGPPKNPSNLPKNPAVLAPVATTAPVVAAAL